MTSGALWRVLEDRESIQLLAFEEGAKLEHSSAQIRETLKIARG
jgi:hypothetical protein